jgi:hypothetical protein
MIRFPSLEASGAQQATAQAQRNEKMQETIRAAAQSIQRRSTAAQRIQRRKPSSAARTSVKNNRTSTTTPSAQRHHHNTSLLQEQNQTPPASILTRIKRDRSTVVASNTSTILAAGISDTPGKLFSASSSNPLERRAGRQRLGLGKHTSNSAFVGNDVYDACASHSVGIQLALAQVMRKHSTAAVYKSSDDSSNNNNNSNTAAGSARQLSPHAQVFHKIEEATPIESLNASTLASTQHLVVCLTQLRNAVLPLPSSHALLQALAVVEQSLFSNWYRPTTEEDEKCAKEMQQFGGGRHRASTTTKATNDNSKATTTPHGRERGLDSSMTQLTNAEVTTNFKRS